MRASLVFLPGFDVSIKPGAEHAAGGEHGLVAVAVGAEPALSERFLSPVDDFDGGGTLVWVHADDDLGHRVLLDPTVFVGGEGSATLSWAVPS
ncbi:hypothetical protein [Micromonospora sp. NPDC048830]|uniref:hypothetical protein n=1 Tax=Micromonospora sp. NPDC048830 TaxID=3364257 RepID=UPI0037185400